MPHPFDSESWPNQAFVSQEENAEALCLTELAPLGSLLWIERGGPPSTTVSNPSPRCGLEARIGFCHSPRGNPPPLRDSGNPPIVDSKKQKIVCDSELGGHLKTYRTGW